MNANNLIEHLYVLAKAFDLASADLQAAVKMTDGTESDLSRLAQKLSATTDHLEQVVTDVTAAKKVLITRLRGLQNMRPGNGIMQDG